LSLQVLSRERASRKTFKTLDSRLSGNERKAIPIVAKNPIADFPIAIFGEKAYMDFFCRLF
jgi:hypothetical protein